MGGAVARPHVASEKHSYLVIDSLIVPFLVQGSSTQITGRHVLMCEPVWADVSRCATSSSDSKCPQSAFQSFCFQGVMNLIQRHNIIIARKRWERPGCVVFTWSCWLFGSEYLSRTKKTGLFLDMFNFVTFFQDQFLLLLIMPGLPLLPFFLSTSHFWLFGSWTELHIAQKFEMLPFFCCFCQHPFMTVPHSWMMDRCTKETNSNGKRSWFETDLKPSGTITSLTSLTGSSLAPHWPPQTLGCELLCFHHFPPGYIQSLRFFEHLPSKWVQPKHPTHSLFKSISSISSQVFFVLGLLMASDATWTRDIRRKAAGFAFAVVPKPNASFPRPTCPILQTCYLHLTSPLYVKHVKKCKKICKLGLAAASAALHLRFGFGLCDLLSWSWQDLQWLKEVKGVRLV